MLLLQNVTYSTPPKELGESQKIKCLARESQFLYRCTVEVVEFNLDTHLKQDNENCRSILHTRSKNLRDEEVRVNNKVAYYSGGGGGGGWK